MIDGNNFFDLPINSELYMKMLEKLQLVMEMITRLVLLDYSYFKENYKMIAIDLSKQKALDADPRAIQQINLIANLDRVGNTTMFFIIEEAKETVLEKTLKIL